ncbi:MAG: hypothetical protein E7271_03645 [Lachnospiraceae bacterium]|jgi:hypothetical protein|nr:hypothetical protein [Lachnospiraceae bacterium]
MAKEKNNDQLKIREELQKVMYYRYKDKEGEIKHEGFIGEAYNNVIKLRKENLNELKNIASKGIGKLSNEGERSESIYEDKNYDNVYNVKYAYAYSQHFNHIYRKLLQEIGEDYVKKNGLTIDSIGAGNYVDYWGLESALYMEKWDVDAIKNIKYRAYEYNKWKRPMKIKEDSRFRIPKDNIALNIGKTEGNFFKIIDKSKEDIKADVVFFPSSFNELIEQNKNDIIRVLNKIDPTYIIITGHKSVKDNDKIKKIISKYPNIEKEPFDKYPQTPRLQSVMPAWKGDNNITNNKAYGAIIGLEGIEGIGHFKPVKNLPQNVSHASYKVKRGNNK